MSTCPSCSTENPAAAKFCVQCGASLAAACPSCGTAAPSGARVCMECGNALATTTEAPAVPVAGEKKHITVLFADVAGSMDLQERLDAEVWATIMGRFVSILAEGVRKFGGTVDKFTGDGIMALFGAPIAQEDHARRACHAAWYLTKSIGELSKELRHTHDVELNVRLGLNSGEVVVGRVGDDGTLDPTALGHTVGLAQRMEAMAEPGRAYLTEYTARLVDGWFRLEHLGAFPVKGARHPLALSVLGAPVASPVRPRVGASPLVGRQRELAVLQDALDMATEGHTQVVGVVGEAGVGKSRLCEEFARTAAARGFIVRRTTGVSHGTEVPLLPILALLRNNFSISEADPPAEARAKLSERLLDLDPALVDDAALLWDLLEVPDPEHPAPRLPPEVRMRRVFELLRRVTARRSEREALVLIVEDLHWFDPQSATFLERLIESYPGTRTLVVTNFRPGFSAAWMRHSYYRQLPLAPLGDRAVRELLGVLVGGQLASAPLLGFMIERTGGNPFFVEEVVRAFISDGTLVGGAGAWRLTRPLEQLRVPPRVQSVLAARIDLLPAEHKQLLQTAAVIGCSFAQPILAAVAGRSDDDLEDGLRALSAAELLLETQRHPRVEYRFWHPLTQEVAYDTLLGPSRRRLHGAVARAVLAVDPARLDEQAAVVAGHYEAAGEQVEAGRWHDRAGSWALRTDLAEAQRRWRTAISLLSEAPQTPESLRLGVHARSKLLRFLARTGVEPAEADRLVREARCLATNHDDATLPLVVLAMEGTSRFFRGEVAGYLDSWREVRRLAHGLGDAALKSFSGVAAGVGSAFVGPLAEGLDAFETLGLAAVDPRLGTVEFGLSMHDVAHTFRCMLLGLAGRLPEASRLLHTTCAFYRERPAPEWEAQTLALVVRLADWTGELDDAVSGAALEAVAVVEETGDVAAHVTALQAKGLADLLDGNHGRAAEIFEAALTEARHHGSGLYEEASLLAFLARAHLATGDQHGAGARAADEAVAVARLRGARVVECLALLTRAKVQRAIGGDPDAIVFDLDGALSLVHDTGAWTYEPFIREELGRVRNEENELREALRLYRQIGATGHARGLHAELHESSQAVAPRRRG